MHSERNVISLSLDFFLEWRNQYSRKFFSSWKALWVTIFVNFAVSGGMCWTSMNNNRCKELLSEGVTREECCASNLAASTAYSDEDLDSGSLFFWRVLGGGVHCYPCRGKFCQMNIYFSWNSEIYLETHYQIKRNFNYYTQKKVSLTQKNFLWSNKFVHCYTVEEKVLWLKTTSWLFFFFN